MFSLLTLYSTSTLSQVLETEESYPLAPGEIVLGTGIEFQRSSEGTETAVPIAIEYGLTKRFTFLIEPVAFTSIHNKIGPSAVGFGDIELTLFYQCIQENKFMPAISISTEIKLPTAKSNLIGTGKIDFTPFIIISKNIGKFFTNVNLSYSFLGKPNGVVAGNLFNYALGTIYNASDKNIYFGEVYGNTSAFANDVPEVIGSTSVLNSTQEISGGELVCSIGYGRYLNKYLLISVGISYDNNNALL